MGLINILQHKSAFEPKPHLIKPYTELFERLDAIMVQAETEGKQTWTLERCQAMLRALKQTFYGANLPERETIWQMLLAENGLQPLWNELCPASDADELQLLCAVIRARHLIGFWKNLLECQAVAVGLIRGVAASVEPSVPEGEWELADVSS